MTEADLDDLDSLLTLLAGAPDSRLGELFDAFSGYYAEAVAPDGTTGFRATQARKEIDDLACRLRSMGQYERAAALFGANLFTVDGALSALHLLQDQPTVRQTVSKLYGALMRDQHEQISASLEEVNKTIPQIVRASS